jgi:hypothetical protein
MGNLISSDRNGKKVCLWLGHNHLGKGSREILGLSKCVILPWQHVIRHLSKCKECTTQNSCSFHLSSENPLFIHILYLWIDPIRLYFKFKNKTKQKRVYVYVAYRWQE